MRRLFTDVRAGRRAKQIGFHHCNQPKPIAAVPAASTAAFPCTTISASWPRRLTLANFRNCCGLPRRHGPLIEVYATAGHCSHRSSTRSIFILLRYGPSVDRPSHSMTKHFCIALQVCPRADRDSLPVCRRFAPCVLSSRTSSLLADSPTYSQATCCRISKLMVITDGPVEK